jgi:hypothetical protein
MKHKPLLIKALGSLLVILGVGCASNVPLSTPSGSAYPESKLSFVDISKFDRELSAALSSDVKEIDVLFYEKVSPNKIPDRMQKWISAIENSGGKVRIDTPPNEPKPRSIMTVLGLLGTAYSAIKNLSSAQSEVFLMAAKGRDAVISLGRGATGELLIERIQFIK